METEFEIASCRCNHAGKAYITVKHLRSGAVLVIQHLPFEHDHDETLEEEQHRIATAGQRLVQDALKFLAAEIKRGADWPTAEHRCGAAPREGEPPNPFGSTLDPIRSHPA